MTYEDATPMPDFLFWRSEVPGRLSMRKKFDAVKFQRKVREELSRKYSTHRDEFLRELKEKYGYPKNKKLARSSDN